MKAAVSRLEFAPSADAIRVGIETGRLEFTSRPGTRFDADQAASHAWGTFSYPVGYRLVIGLAPAASVLAQRLLRPARVLGVASCLPPVANLLVATYPVEDGHRPRRPGELRPGFCSKPYPPAALPGGARRQGRVEALVDLPDGGLPRRHRHGGGLPRARPDDPLSAHAGAAPPPSTRASVPRAGRGGDLGDAPGRRSPRG